MSIFNRSPEQLHRLKDNSNDWDGLADNELNRWQRVAKKTRGIVTAANAITLFGTIAVMNGLADFANGQKVSGTLKVGLGRMLDLADGKVADRTGTKGKVGRDLDPTMDFVQLGVALPVLVNEGVVALPVAAVVAAPKVADAIGTVAAKVRGIELNPTDEGKVSAFVFWSGLGSLMVGAALEKHLPGIAEAGFEIAGTAGVVGGSLMHAPATADYLRAGFGPAPVASTEA